jgi:pimeloyl-ACP methyl ester carboxylesterase
MQKWVRGLLAVPGVVGLLALVGFSYQAQSVARDRVLYPPPGDLIDVGGYHLHMRCEGEGSPTIVVESGTGTWSLMWFHLLPELAERSRTCLYDRAGYGWSEASGQPHTASNSADDLRAVLTQADIAPPYVLVGHSYGGWVVRLFHDRYPDDVAGLVLVDSGHHEQWERLPAAFGAAATRQAQVLAIMEWGAPLGIPRLLAPADPYLTAARQPIYRAAVSLGRSSEAVSSEFEHAVVSSQQTAHVRDFGHTPLAVISAENSLQAFAVLDSDLPFAEGNRVWRELQAELADLSTNRIHLVSDHGDHYLHATDPDLVLEGLDWVLDTHALDES